VDAKELEEYLFRREAGRLVAILTGLFGMHNLTLAEESSKTPSAGRLKPGSFMASLTTRPLGY